MKKRAILTAFVLVLSVYIFVPAAVAADQDLERQLTSQYHDKVMALRHSYKSRSQEYAADGAPFKAGEEGPWTLYGRMRVRKISVDPDRLALAGRRVLYFFDKDGKQTEYPDDRGQPFEDLKITVRLQKPLSTADEAATILGHIFAVTAEDAVNSAPAYWQAYLAKQLGVQGQKEQGSKKLHCWPQKINTDCAPPHILYIPEPEFSEAARVRKFQGVVGMNVIVDTTGKATNMKIDRPLGMGLEEQAVAAVSAWKFAPAKEDGQPVQVAIYVEVDFRLY
jgi:TonB family protein